MSNAQRLSMLGMLVIAISLPLVALGAAKPAATVQASSGALSVQRSGTTSFASLPVRGPLYIGDLVGTGAGAKASLIFADGSMIRLKPDCAVRITKPEKLKGRKLLCQAISGEVWARIRPGRAIETRGAAAGTRGTEFLLSVAPDETTTLTVLDGEVDFFNEHGATVVGSGEQSTARLGAAPTTPVSVPNPGVMIEWILDLERALTPRERLMGAPDRGSAEAQAEAAAAEVRAAPQDVDALVRYGELLFDAGDLDAALEAFQAADQLTPNQPTPLTRIGDALLELGRVEEAETSYLSALNAQAAFAPALRGLAWLELTRNRPADAQTLADRAINADATSAEAALLQGVALMRQGGMLAQAEETLRGAADMDQSTYAHQARSWLALVHLAQDDADAALVQAQAAVEAAPSSAVVRGNLALVSFFAGQPLRAEREARRALALDPDSVAAQCTLGQALLGTGDVQAAAQVAGRAVALDPTLPQARYLLGVVDAQRRDYRHASRDLEECLRLAPDYLPAASALARVYVAMGREDAAVQLLTDLLPRARNADNVHAALGAVHYQRGDYGASIAAFREAVRLRPDSALHHAELCRVLTDANRLNEAVAAGMQAVQLAPDVGQYHAILGVAYQFARMNVQSERELRQALSLDPRNALAQLVLGLQAAAVDPDETRIFPKSNGLSLEDLVKQGVQSMASGLAVGSIAQASLHDPAVVTQTLRGGTDTTLTAQGGSDSLLAAAAASHHAARDGALHGYALGDYSEGSGARANDDTTAWGVSETAAWSMDDGSDAFVRFSHRSIEQGLAGSISEPDLDDRSRTKDTYLQTAVRSQLGKDATLWASLSHRKTEVKLSDPGLTSFQVPVKDPAGNYAANEAIRQTLTVTATVPELRADINVDRTPGREATLSLGGARIPLELRLDSVILYPHPTEEEIPVRVDGHLTAIYGEWNQRLSDHLSVAAQMRFQRYQADGVRGLLGGGTESAGGEETSYWLPSVVVNYQPGDKTLMRFLYNRQAPEQDFAVIALTPYDTLLVTEPLVMTRGIPDSVEVMELDIERYLGSRDFVKVFLFKTKAKGTDLGDLPDMAVVKRHGIGVRYERQLSDRLFGQAGFVLNRTTNDTPFAPFDGGSAPYHPWRLGGVGLNYVDPGGTKAGLQVNYTGEFFQDTGLISARTRPRFADRAYVDLSFAHEPSVNREYFVKISNLFDTDAIQFNDFPTGGRQIVAGANVRF